MHERNPELEGWVRDYWDDLVRVAEQYRGRMTTAQDIALEALLLAHGKREELRRPEKTKQWLIGFVRNVGQKARDKRRRREDLMRKRYDLLEREPPTRPDEILENRQKEEALERAIEGLEEPQREIVRLKLDGLTYREIATHLDMPLGTVKSHRSRALVALREALAREGIVFRW